MKGAPEIRTLEVRKEYPPIFDMIVKVFPMAAKPGVVFAWGGILYNPANVEVTPWMAAHENVHMRQQEDYDGGVLGWWGQYLADLDFRFEQEKPAHVEEYRRWCIEFKRRNSRRVGERMIAERLSGPLYNNMISYEKARAILKDAAREERKAA